MHRLARRRPSQDPRDSVHHLGQRLEAAGRNMMQTRQAGFRPRSARARRVVFITVLLATAIAAGFAMAQTANSNAGLYGGQDGLFDAILATPNRKTAGPQDKSVATPPGAEYAAPTPHSKTKEIVTQPIRNRAAPGEQH